MDRALSNDKSLRESIETLLSRSRSVFHHRETFYVEVDKIKEPEDSHTTYNEIKFIIDFEDFKEWTEIRNVIKRIFDETPFGDAEVYFVVDSPKWGG